MKHKSNNLLNESVNDVVAKKPNLASENSDAFVRAVATEFINKKLDSFPWICYETRKANHEIKKYHADCDNAAGWSEKKDFKFDYTIPKDMYHFMTNLVYKNFWDEENEKIWRPFMKSVCRGDEPMQLLAKVKHIYASAPEMIKAGLL